jgi:hypothetical protein
VTTSGTLPSTRGGHSATLVGSIMVVFGGHYYVGQSKFAYLNELHVLDLVSV